MNGKLFEDRAQRLRDATIIAIFRMRAPEHAVEGIGAAVRGGFEAVEVTLNSPGATDALSEVAGRTDAIVGAGTVLSAEAVKEAYDAGAEFIVTPIVEPEVVDAAHGLSLPVLMGASTPTEIHAARRAGADWVKVFPAESLGGPDYITHILGPLDGTPILVTGGITGENYLGYLDAGAELVGFANAVFDPQLAEDGRYDEIERRAVEINRRLDLYITEQEDAP
ncbi:MAG TPA: bifunctional 4-hydroxy-2-oxoglutarate aldolase/2-dehydro-3-deoxy-phosphogluconate aldolase [Actinomycetota bacterium]|jgi:2-dehydro-3-deoxyphosphogluconate aldolase / (4S)-4-hydroxy-2-oxoglutarate aldolase|nr:bifunctional 4-hydroxy-2-oxoglutarate aldolase/2-dehydro-3-deoxy-phosphogluconate aldolase [Actinomycetota bacterium]